MEEEFKEWLKVKKQAKSSTRSNYAIHLREHIPKFLLDIDITEGNLFDIRDKDRIIKYLKEFQKSGSLYNVNIKQGNFPSAAMMYPKT